MSNKQPKALQYADEIDRDEQFHLEEAAAELRRLHAVNQALAEALRGLDEAYCRAGCDLSHDERHEDRMRLIAARAALAAAQETK